MKCDLMETSGPFCLDADLQCWMLPQLSQGRRGIIYVLLPHTTTFDIYDSFVVTRSDEVSGTPPHPRNPKYTQKITERMKSEVNDNEWKSQVINSCICSLLPYCALFYLMSLAHSFMVMQIRAIFNTNCGLDGWLAYSYCSWNCVNGLVDLLFWGPILYSFWAPWWLCFILVCAYFDTRACEPSSRIVKIDCIATLFSSTSWPPIYPILQENVKQTIFMLCN